MKRVLNCLSKELFMSTADPETNRLRLTGDFPTARCLVSAVVITGLMGLSACGPSSPSTGVAGSSSINAAQEKSASLTKDKESGRTDTAATARKVVASVDDQIIYEDELQPLIQTGVDRAVALDRAINRVVTSRAARQQFSAESEKAVSAATRDILSQLYLQKATERLSAKVTDEEIKSWYDKRIVADDYRQYQASYALTANSEEAAELAADAGRGEKKALARFQSVTDQPNGWMRARDFPYGLGNIIGRMKPGDFSKPIALRNGWFVLHLKQTRENPPPSLDSVKAEIRNIIVSEALVKDISEIRHKSRIELK